MYYIVRITNSFGKRTLGYVCEARFSRASKRTGKRKVLGFGFARERDCALRFDHGSEAATVARYIGDLLNDISTATHISRVHRRTI